MIPGLGGLGGMNPKKMQGMLKQLGMSQEEIDASRVIIEKSDNNKIVIENPSVTKISMQGQESFQITGNIREETDFSILEEDLKTIVNKTGASEEDARKALEETRDLAEAILKLSG
jgi:nascent polypeptide-associated complex subunit alpha